HREDESEALRQAAPKGVDVWWETLREPDLERAIGHLALRGRVVLMAGRDAKPVFPVGPFYTRDCQVVGFAMFNAPADQQQKAAEDINRWLAEGKLRARISRVMKLSETAEAHRLQEQSTLHRSGVLAGKIVLEP
ncbi:MAG: zinc-binding dehydrogenase, partial [Thermoguttaceae bacterium]|nr:zinc-binding dehydrogenase [Thermoguttaceae bacterium]